MKTITSIIILAICILSPFFTATALGNNVEFRLEKASNGYFVKKYNLSEIKAIDLNGIDPEIVRQALLNPGEIVKKKNSIDTRLTGFLEFIPTERVKTVSVSYCEENNSFISNAEFIDEEIRLGFLLNIIIHIMTICISGFLALTILILLEELVLGSMVENIFVVYPISSIIVLCTNTIMLKCFNFTSESIMPFQIQSFGIITLIILGTWIANADEMEYETSLESLAS